MSEAKTLSAALEQAQAAPETRTVKDILEGMKPELERSLQSEQASEILLRHYFNAVEYLPLSGTATRHSRLQSLPNLFVRDIAWVASSPKSAVGPWKLGRM